MYRRIYEYVSALYIMDGIKNMYGLYKFQDCSISMDIHQAWELVPPCIAFDSQLVLGVVNVHVDMVVL